MKAENFGVIGICFSVLAPLMMILGVINDKPFGGIALALVCVAISSIAFYVGYKRHREEQRLTKDLWLSCWRAHKSAVTIL